jgi:hypothetical protein
VATFAAYAADSRKRQRWPHDPNAPYLVPPIAQSAAQGRGDPIVRELIFTLERLYYRRGALRNELFNDLGDRLFPAFPELLLRPPKRRRKSVETATADEPPLPEDVAIRAMLLRARLAADGCGRGPAIEGLNPGDSVAERYRSMLPNARIDLRGLAGLGG